MSYTSEEQLINAEQDLLDDENVLAVAEMELQDHFKWIESRKAVVEEDKKRIAKLKLND